MQFKPSVVIALSSLLLSPGTHAAPAPDEPTPLRDQIASLDQTGQIQWEDVPGGRAAVIAPPNHQGRDDDDTFKGFPNPVDWLGSQWNDLHADVKVQGNPGRALCVGGGSKMVETIIDAGAHEACNYFVGRSQAGKLGLMVWHAFEQKDYPTDAGPGFIRWLMGSVSKNPTEMTDEFCRDMWLAVKSMCIDGTTTQGQAISAGDWTLYADPNKYGGS